MNINGKTIGEIEIQNLRTTDSGMAHYRVDAVVDGQKVTAYFQHLRGDGLIACTSRAMDAIMAANGKILTPLSQTYTDTGRI